MTPATPDWTHWLKCESARAWEWLALSVNVEPGELGLSHFLALRQPDSRLKWSSDNDPEWLQELGRRYRSLVGFRERTGDPLTSLDDTLSNRDFAVWILARKWKLPLELREHARSITNEPAAAETDQTDSRTQSAGAADKSAASETAAPTSKSKPATTKKKAAPSKRKRRSPSKKAQAAKSKKTT